MTRLEEPNDKDFTDALFRQLPAVEPSAELRRLVEQIPSQHPRSNVIVWPLRSLWQPALALVAAACIGFLVGQRVNDVGFSGGEEVADLQAATDDFSVEMAAEMEGEILNTEGDEDLEGLLMLATLADFETADWETPFDTTASAVQEETF